ncbi:ABC transporter substrate-binding protein [Oceanibium sediminis]|uniref:ABC transporter substrate-binding protein n=1 Tax=Oceanibium sediminis TaxID=2026339 RepID=UPI000DD47D67|nr:ABC transporter substrate-binding protein [Oceanibium sediminis]
MTLLTPTRREALIYGGAAAAALSLGVPAMSAPKKGGTLRIAMAHGSTSENYDPGSWTAAFEQVFAAARHCYLTEVAADGTLIGEVAESWEGSSDAKTWTFRIRKGITFHDGRTLTPQDVVASLNYHRREGSTSAAKNFVDPITDIQVDGDNLVVSLDGGNADFPFIMSDYHLPIMPDVDGLIDPTSSIGCGGYIVQSFEPGVRASLSRNPNYWKEGRAHFDGIEILSVLDPAARQAALMTGDVDVIDQVDLKTVALFQRAPSVKVLATTGTQHYTFAMDTRATPFADNNVRLAMKHGIDRQELVDKILFGYGAIGNDHPISSSQRFHAGDLEQNSYDPDKSKFYLKKAGLDSVNVKLSAADAAFGGAVDAAVLYAEKARAGGINIEVVREANDGYWSDVWMKKPFCAVYWGGRPTEDWMFTTAYAADAAWNDTFWNNERFNELLIAARAEVNMERRAEMYRDMQDICRTDGGMIVPMFASYVMAHSDKVQTPETVGANWTLDGFRAVERWWFNA